MDQAKVRRHVVDGVRGLNLECNGLASKGLDRYLHTATKTKDEMKSGLFLNVVVGEGGPSSNCFPAKMRRC